MENASDSLKACGRGNLKEKKRALWMAEMKGGTMEYVWGFLMEWWMATLRVTSKGFWMVILRVTWKGFLMAILRVIGRVEKTVYVKVFWKGERSLSWSLYLQ